MPRAGDQDLVDVNLVAGPAQQLPPGHVAQDGDEGIAYGAQDPLRLRCAVEAELAVHARDDEIEAAQNIIGVIEGAVGQDVGLDAFEDAEARAELGVEAIRLAHAALRFPRR